MPEICRISELSIQMIYQDHDNPHVHILRHTTELAVINFNGTIRRGNIESDKLKKIRTWMQEHQGELMENWDRAKMSLKLKRIKS